MHQKQDENGSGPSDLDRDLREQQGLLLSQIDALVSSPSANNKLQAAKIYNFKQEYNILVGKRAVISRNPFSDPMEVLPPDLWPEVVRNIVEGSRYPTNKLLDLISVSKGWCSVLTTLPMIWTDIRLDQCEPDYLAKAIMCVQLSGKCEIDLCIWGITAEEWRKISSLIVPEGKRIRCLEFIDTPDYSVTREVLESFTKLPVLQDLILPIWPAHLSDHEHLDTSISEKMPFIRRLTTREGIIRGKIPSPYITAGLLLSGSATSDYLDTLAVLPQLLSLTISENAKILDYNPSKGSFESLTSLTYQGHDICRHLTWIGSNLTVLSTEYAGNVDIGTLIMAISRFSRLRELRINVLAGSWGPLIENKNERVPASPEYLLKVAKIVLTSRENTLDQSKANWDAFFPKLFAASPHLETLHVYDGFITDLGWNCIQGVANLHNLAIDGCEFGDSSLAPLKTASVRIIRWKASLKTLVQLLAVVQSHFVQTLRLGILECPPDPAFTYVIAGSAFPNITFLAISATGLFRCEIGTLSRLTKLQLKELSDESGYFSHWVGDIWEAILMRPRDNPFLESIVINCEVVEWDILLLMLERRNFLNDPAVSSINTLVFKYDLSYRLLYPLSNLLGGRFVERDSNHSFSVEAIGDHKGNRSLTGCRRCHNAFRKCESLVLPPSGGSPEDVGQLREYPLPHEYLVAEPELPPDVNLWLSGRLERRYTYFQKFGWLDCEFSRIFACDISRNRFGGSVVNGDILAGAHFADELEENDAGLEA